MHIVCSDLEGIFLPEIWIKFAEKTGIQELRLTRGRRRGAAIRRFWPE